MSPVRRVEDFAPGLTAREVLVIADDLAGAAESAAAMTSWSPASCELRLSTAQRDGDPSTALVIDTDSRYLPPLEARARVIESLAARPGATLIFKKIDSLVRGNVADETAALRESGRHVIACAAMPAVERTVVNGRVKLSGVPLHETDAWAAEIAQPPRSLTQVFHPQYGHIVTLSVVRSNRLTEELRHYLELGMTPVCDAETQADLDRIVDSTLQLMEDYPLALVGTGAMARALGKRLHPTGEPTTEDPTSPDGPALVVVGTLAPTAVEQVRRLVLTGAEHIVLVPGDLADESASATRRIRAAVEAGVAVVTMDRESAWDRRSMAAIAQLIAPAVDGIHADLVLTGGETARRMLDVLDIQTIYPFEELDSGTVLSRSVDGVSVVTRPGSFGPPDSLVDIVGRLRAPASWRSSTTSARR